MGRFKERVIKEKDNTCMICGYVTFSKKGTCSLECEEEVTRGTRPKYDIFKIKKDWTLNIRRKTYLSKDRDNKEYNMYLYYKGAKEVRPTPYTKKKTKRTGGK